MLRHVPEPHARGVNIQYSAFGPFLYRYQTNENTTSLFADIEKERAELEHGVGIYFFAASNSAQKIIPWYVGLSVAKDFGARVMGHLNKDKFRDVLAFDRGLSIYFLAAVTESCLLLKAGDLSGEDKQAIRALERSLIGSAVRVNEGVLNSQDRESTPLLRMPNVIECESSQSNAAKDIASFLNIEQH